LQAEYATIVVCGCGLADIDAAEVKLIDPGV
jgi:hypothetical protein